MSFRDIEIKTEYRSGKSDVIKDFYVPVLAQARKYKRAVGFFSSTALVQIARGIAELVANGGKIELIKNETTAFGIYVTEGNNQATNLTIGGKIIVNVDNTASISNDKAFGVWKEAGYNPIDSEQPEDMGGTITLNNADITVKGNEYALGLIAGNDFGNNSESGGRILVNGDISVNTSTQNGQQASYANMQRTIGALVHSGIIELHGNINTFTVNGASYGNDYGEIAGFYTCQGGRITSDSNSDVTITVSGKKVYGISSGYYDCIHKDKRGLSGVNLQGRTIINLGGNYDGKSTNVGVAAYAKSKNYIKDLTINFMNDEYYSNTGLITQAEGQIDVGSLYIGIDENSVQDPTKITAVSTDVKTFFG